MFEVLILSWFGEWLLLDEYPTQIGAEAEARYAHRRSSSPVRVDHVDARTCTASTVTTLGDVSSYRRRCATMFVPLGT